MLHAQLPARAGQAARAVDYETFEKINPRLVYRRDLRLSRRRSARRQGRPTTTSSRPARAWPRCRASSPASRASCRPSSPTRPAPTACLAAVLAALFAPARTGKGQAVEVPMFETLVSLRHGRASLRRDLRAGARHGGLQARAQQGPATLSVEGRLLRAAALHRRNWREFCALVGRARPADDPRFKTLGIAPARTSSILLRRAGRDLRHAHQRRVAAELRTHSTCRTMAGQHAGDLFVDPQLEATGFWQDSRASDRGQAAHAGHPAALQQDPARDQPPAAAAGRAQRRGAARGRVRRGEITALVESGAARVAAATAGPA